MDSKQQDFNLSQSTRSNAGEPSAQKKIKSLTLFEDLLDDPATEKLHLEANSKALGDKDSSIPHYQNEAYAANEEKSWLSAGFSRISDDNIVYQNIKKNLISSLNSGGFDVEVETIYRNGHSSTMGRAKYQSFGIYKMAIKEKCGGNANVNFAWYGTSKNEINGIISYGFSLPLNNSIYGHGFYLSEVHHPLGSLRPSIADANGVRHMLLCRVILGKMEVITPGSGQHNPSSVEFDSGVDNLMHPRKFIFWNAMVNTYVLPEFIVSFRTSANCSGSQRIPRTIVLPESDWIPIATLINGLSNFIPNSTRKLLDQYVNDYKKQKITRETMVKNVRLIAGDRLLMTMIKSFGEKGKASNIQAPK